RTLTGHQIVEIIARTMNYAGEIICLPDAVASPVRPFRLHATSHHRVMDLSKIKKDLGYTDRIAPEAALVKTVQWLLEHLPERGGEIEQRLQDPFDYAAEDQLVAIFKESLARMAAIPFDKTIRPHPYAHPKVPGQQRDHRER
ncbi:MAG: hypothetical protein ACRERD_16245, partial [Candidatus Binatia bacterium]